MKQDKIFYKRNLPHIEPVGATFFVTCSLNGAIPKAKLSEIKERYYREKNAIELAQDKKLINYGNYKARSQYIFNIDNLLHENTGPTYLENANIARMLLARIESYNMQYYKLLALSIMPNHFHMLIDTSVQIRGILEPNTTPKGYLQLDQIMDLIKGGAARYINQFRQTTGEKVWEKESFNVYIRNEKMLEGVINCILDNPVKAGLVKSCEDHPFTFALDY